MIPRSASEGQEVNSRKADEVFAEHGWRRLVQVPEARVWPSALKAPELALSEPAPDEPEHACTE